MTIKTEHLKTTELEPPYIERYYDNHPEEIEGVELSQLPIHALVMNYLFEVLKWLFHEQAVGVMYEINLYQSNHPDEMPVAPDVTAIDKYVPSQNKYQSYKIDPPERPTPRLAIEISSESTWEIDFDKKFKVYQAIGVLEYFIFDPNEEHIWDKNKQQEAGGNGRLIGWRLNDQKKFERIPLDNDRLWSFQADSWLAVEDDYLRLYDLQNRRRLTEAEYNDQQRENERREKEIFAAKLRELGINPDDLLR